MWDYIKLVVLGLIAVLAAIAANYAHDLAYMVNALTVMLAAAATFVWVLRTAGDRLPTPMNEYNDGVVRAGAIATAFWGVVGFLVGVVIAFQLAFPALNFEWADARLPELRPLRPLHTSAVIFAFGGNALIMSPSTSSSAPRLRGSGAATSPGSCSGATSCSSCWPRPAISSARTQGKEYAEPEWYVDSG
jgi:cytochrome c oxidase cbb3-type subunit 1